MAADLHVRALAFGDLDAYLAHLVDTDRDSGVDGTPHFHPYGRDEVVDLGERRTRERTRWSTPLDEPGWRRAWGLFDGETLVGHLYLAGGMLPTELHRATLGIAIAASHRGRGGGTMLLSTALTWARERPEIAWVDLGVFSDNPGARALYERLGFEVVGEVADRFRIDGVSIGDTQMTVAVA